MTSSRRQRALLQRALRGGAGAARCRRAAPRAGRRASASRPPTRRPARPASPGWLPAPSRGGCGGCGGLRRLRRGGGGATWHQAQELRAAAALHRGGSGAGAGTRTDFRMQAQTIAACSGAQRPSERPLQAGGHRARCRRLPGAVFAPRLGVTVKSTHISLSHSQAKLVSPPQKL